MRSGVESRSAPRVAVSLPVALRFPDGEPAEGWGRILDLSVAGVRLESRFPHRVGQSVQLTFFPVSKVALQNLPAKVVRVSWESGYYVAGLAFDPAVDKGHLKLALMTLISRAQ